MTRSKTPPVANVKPAGAGAGASMRTAVSRPGWVTSANEAVTACGTFCASVAVTGCKGVSTTPPTGGVTVTEDVALPWFPLASRKVKTTLVVPTGNSVVAVAATGDPSMTASTDSRVGAASPASTAEPPARNALRLCDALEAAMLPRAPSTCVAATVSGAGGVTTGGVVSMTVTVNDAAP